jgi:hypothetical protein
MHTGRIKYFVDVLPNNVQDEDATSATFEHVEHGPNIPVFLSLIQFEGATSIVHHSTNHAKRERV